VPWRAVIVDEAHRLRNVRTDMIHTVFLSYLFQLCVLGHSVVRLSFFIELLVVPSGHFMESIPCVLYRPLYNLTALSSHGFRYVVWRKPSVMRA
jgi:hypothetical protein